MTPDSGYHTGDAGSVDDEGFLYVRESVFPEFDDVREVAVIGVPDPTWGELGLAVVVPSPGTATGKIRKPDLRNRYVTTEESPA